MAVYACSSTITAQTQPMISINPATLQNDMVLQFDVTLGVFVARTLSIGGNSVFSDVSSLGTGISVYGGRTDGTLNLRGIKAGNNLTVTTDGNDITIGIANGGTLLNTGDNIGNGAEVYKETTGNILYFRTIALDPTSKNLSITQTADEIVFKGTGEVNTVSSIGTGTSIFDSKSGEDLQFRSIVGGNNLNVTISGSDIIFDVDFNFNVSAEGGVLVVTNGEVTPLDPPTSLTRPYGLTTGTGGVSEVGWDTTAITRTMRITFEQDGSLENVLDVPSDMTATRIGNQITVTHPFGTWPKFVSYYGRDNITNKFKLRYPTGNYQVQLDGNNPTTTFTIDVIAAVAGADANGYAYVNLVF
jgi:hypothetical protein